ncbi:MAG: hypothetical protein HY841_01505 [Bacteroidetes bacterium]|nr:hypothetical protein [Bacteroidota bacterium]
MKTNISIGVIAVLFIGVITAASAQKVKIKVDESNEHIGGNKNPALVVSIYDATPDEVANKWKSLMKDYKGKMSTNDGVFADNAVIQSINGNNTIDVYAKTEKVKDGETKLIVAFDLGGAFLSSSNNNEKLKEAKKIVNDFAIKTTKDAITGQRKAAEKVLGSIEDDQHSLEKKQEKLNSNIEDYKAKIEDYNKRIKEAQDDLAKNKTDQEKKKGEVDAQKKIVDAVTAKENAVE